MSQFILNRNSLSWFDLFEEYIRSSKEFLCTCTGVYPYRKLNFTENQSIPIQGVISSNVIHFKKFVTGLPYCGLVLGWLRHSIFLQPSVSIDPAHLAIILQSFFLIPSSINEKGINHYTIMCWTRKLNSHHSAYCIEWFKLFKELVPYSELSPEDQKKFEWNYKAWKNEYNYHDKINLNPNPYHPPWP